tara:strand:+ start:51 stop:593 length:543 start_codon:yes stop_codon:yes gene_type:complete
MADGTLKVGTITTSSGSGTITIGQSGETIALGSGASQTLAINTPAFFVTKTSTQSIADSTFTDVIFETEEIDTDSAFSSTTFTVPSGKAGKYFTFGQIRFETSTDFSYTLARIVHNSTNVVSAWDRNLDYTTVNCQAMVTLAVGDTLKLQCRQQSGGALNLGANDQGHVTYFGAYKIIGA